MIFMARPFRASFLVLTYRAILTLMIPVAWSGASGQAIFVGYQSSQTVVASTTLNGPGQIAVDAAGNIYITDAGNNRVLKETPSAAGYIETTVAQNGLYSPRGVAVDARGNVYVADTLNGRVLKETLSGGNYTESVVKAPSVNSWPSNIAVDGSGNVYVVDVDNGLWKETPSGGGYIQSLTPAVYTADAIPSAVAVDRSGNVFLTSGGEVVKLIPTGDGYAEFIIAKCNGFCQGIAVDGEGNVFQSASGFGQVYEATPASAANNAAYSDILVDEDLKYPVGLAVDGKGNLYISDSENDRVLKDTVANGDFGTVAVGSPSRKLSLIFAWDAEPPVTLGAISVVTQGVEDLDFSDAGTGTCVGNRETNVYSANGTCTVDAVFTPRAPGPRYGAVNLMADPVYTSAAVYLQGMGTGPQVGFTPGSQSKLPLNKVASSSAIAMDAVGSLYIAEAVGVNSPANAVVKEAWTGNGYTQTTVATGLAYPVGVAVDGAGNVLIADQAASAILIAVPSSAGYTVSTFFSNVGNVEGVAVDGGGNIYFASNALGVVEEIHQGPYLGYFGYTQSILASKVFADGIVVDGAGIVYLSDSETGSVLKERPQNGGYTQSVVASGLNGPHGLAVDPSGSVYIAESSANQVVKETLTGGSYKQSNVGAGIVTPDGVTMDGAGNLYVSSGNGEWKLDFADTPSLAFASTPVGSTSSDSPKTVTLENTGNAPLIFPAPKTGYNPSIAANFTLNSSGPSACPLASASSAPEELAEGASCQLPISFTPQAAGEISGSLALTDNNLNGVAIQSIALAVTGAKDTPQIAWETPAPIQYGTALGGAELNASTSVPGTFAYAPALGTVLGGGPQELKVTFTPSDTADYNTATGTVTLTVTPAEPVITWADPMWIRYGSGLGSNQLDAKSSVTGTFTYAPAAGSVPKVGADTLTVTFTPTDRVNYAVVTDSVLLTVYAATPVISWPTPAPIVYGTALSANQLDARASTAGTYVYRPAAGTLLSAGAQQLEVTFVPADTVDYGQTSAYVTLTILQATPKITWPVPAAIVYGTAVGAQQLDASSSVPGGFQYTPAAGTVLAAGTQTLTALFYPYDSYNNKQVTASVKLTVLKATPKITWPDPAAIAYGTPLSTTELDATSPTPGTFTYLPAVGTVLAPGNQTLKVTFTPANTADYATVTATTSLTVTRGSAAVSAAPWANPVTKGTSGIVTVTIQKPSAGVSPTGQVSVFWNGILLKTGTLNSNGQAPLTVSAPNAVGILPLYATYSGDGNYLGGKSAVVEVTVQP